MIHGNKGSLLNLIINATMNTLLVTNLNSLTPISCYLVLLHIDRIQTYRK